MQPGVVVVVLLFHEPLLNDDCEDVRDYTNRHEYIAVQVDLRDQGVNLDHVVVRVKDHVTVHQRKQGVATD